MFKKIFYKPAQPETGGNAPWSSPAEFDETWKRRIQVMASYIRGPGRVADFGCGPMWLKSFLPAGNTYLGIDSFRRDEHTLVLDLNRDSLSRIQADIAFLSGILEYIQEIPRFIENLTALPFRQIITSYCTLENFPDLKHRQSLNWVSHESLLTLLPHFLRHCDLAALDDVNKNTILVFSRKAG